MSAWFTSWFFTTCKCTANHSRQMQSGGKTRTQSLHTITAHNHCTRPAAAKCFPRPSHRLTRYLELEVAYFLTMCSVTFTTSPDGVVGYVCRWMQREREGVCLFVSARARVCVVSMYTVERWRKQKPDTMQHEPCSHSPMPERRQEYRHGLASGGCSAPSRRHRTQPST